MEGLAEDGGAQDLFFVTSFYSGRKKNEQKTSSVESEMQVRDNHPWHFYSSSVLYKYNRYILLFGKTCMYYGYTVTISFLCLH